MEAILIIDMPENCRDCPYFGFNCKLTNEKCNWFNEDGRHKSCPLRILPEALKSILLLTEIAEWRGANETNV